MIELWLTIQLKFVPTIKIVRPTYIKHEPGVRTMYAHSGVHASDVSKP